MIAIENVTVAGISAVVPSKSVNNNDLSEIYGVDETKKIIKSIGVEKRHIVNQNQTASDLCFQSAISLLEKLNWDNESVDAVIFVSQTPDYQLPATACVLQHRLGLSNDTIAFDINMGCSGYVYGLYVASSLIKSSNGRVLLLVGDTISQIVKPGDRSTELLFGDAGTATALEYKQDSCLKFELGSDGSGAKHIIAKQSNNIFANDRGLNTGFLEMNGGEVFSFTLSRIPKLIKSFLQDIKLTQDDISQCVFHQANRFMIQHLAKKSKFNMEKVPLSIVEYGNTSCASIPMTLCHARPKTKLPSLLVGFGVGLSWGAVLADLSKTVCLEIQEL
jgi:3-oxoacyl-[acyl-carrier-protein] synthase-3